MKSKSYKQNPKANVALGLILILIGISALLTIYFTWDIFLKYNMMFASMCILFLSFILLITGFERFFFNKRFYIKITEDFIEINRGFYCKKIKIADIENVYNGIEEVVLKTKSREFHLYELNSENEINQLILDIKGRIAQRNDE